MNFNLLFLENILKLDVSTIMAGNSKIKAPYYRN